jgi:predicted transcriptional regulator/O-methyltransferase involved in polyketide biosynthesis
MSQTRQSLTGPGDRLSPAVAQGAQPGRVHHATGRSAGLSPGTVPGLSPLESAVMGLLWDEPGGLPTREISSRLSVPAQARTTALGALRTLYGKGLVSRDRHGRWWHYRAAGNRDQHLAALVRDTLSAAPDRQAVLRLALPQDTCPDPRPPRHRQQQMARPAQGSGLPGLQPSPVIDTTVAHPARVWSYWLGGKDHYRVDRETGDQILSIVPELADSARASRYFLARVMRYLAGQEQIRQFLDIGAGLPCADNTHQIAQREAPSSRIVYADSDPMVVAHARALLTSGPQGACDSINADLRNPDDIIAGAARTLDFTQPVAILLLGVLSFVTDTGQALAIVRQLLGAAAAGSYLVICHPTTEIRAQAMTAAARLWNQRGSAPVTLRTRQELARFFDGLDLAEPGVVSCPRWRPDLSDFAQIADVPHYCGAGRKPPEAASA